MTVTLIILSVVFSVIAHVMAAISGYAKMVCDLSEESKLNKTPFEYWHKHLSSNNKNKYTGKIKIWLMRNLFIAQTDGWHKYQFVLTVCLILSGFFVGFISGKVTAFYSFQLLSVYFVRTATFHLLYTSKKYRI
jgi:hypothetical protein